jgi:anti-sigma B factor antagonist
MASGIHISRSSNGIVLVEIRGDLDIERATALRDLLVDTASGLRPPGIVVDLRHVTFIDSTGLGVLAAGRNAARQVGVRFTVREPPAFVARQLRQTGLYDVLVSDR